MNRGQRTVVAGVHGLEHVERFFAAHLADDDAIGTHAQSVDDELPLPDRALAFDVGRARLEPHDVLLVQLQFGRVLDGDDALAIRNERDSTFRSVVLPAPVPPVMSDVEPRLHRAAPGTPASAGQRALCDQVFGLQPLGRKTPNRQERDRRRRAAE